MQKQQIVLLKDTVLEIEKRYTNDTHISYELLLHIVSLIQNKMNKYGKAELSYRLMSTIIGVSKSVIVNHIDWLLYNNIIDRNGLRFNGDTKKFYTYIYTIIEHELTSLELFEFNVAPNVKNKYKLTVDCEIQRKAFYDVTIDMKGAIAYLENEVRNGTKTIKECASALLKLYNIHIGNIRIKKGKNSNRHYTNITELPSWTHRFIYINNYQVSELDAKASQLMITSCLTRHIESSFHTDIFNDIYTNILNEIISTKQPTDWLIVDYPGCHKIDNKKPPKFGYVRNINRDTIKKILYANVFSAFKLTDPISSIFNKRYKNIIDEVYVIFNLFKFTKDKLAGSYLACQLQTIESDIWVGSSKEMNINNKSNLTKHDSILIPKQHIQDAVENVHKKYSSKNFDFDSKLNLKIELRDNFQINEYEPKKYLNVPSYKEHHSYNKSKKHVFIFNGIEFMFTIKELCSVFSVSKPTVYKLINSSSNEFSIQMEDKCYQIINNKQIIIQTNNINNKQIIQSVNNLNQTIHYCTFRRKANSKDSNTPLKTAPFSTEKYKFTLNDKSHKWTISEFMNKTGFIKQRVNDLLRGNKKQYKGWTVLKIEPKVNPTQLRADRNQQIREARHNILKIIDNSKWDSVLFDKEDTEKLFNSLNVIPYFKNRTEYVNKCDGFVVRSGCLVMFHDNFKQGIYTEIYSFKFKKHLEMYFVDTTDIEGIRTIEEQLESLKSPIERLFRF